MNRQFTEGKIQMAKGYGNQGSNNECHFHFHLLHWQNFETFKRGLKSPTWPGD